MKSQPFAGLDGALLVRKHAGISSFGIVDELGKLLLTHENRKTPSSPAADGINPVPLRKRDLPKIGHGGTLDPFATGLLVVCVGRAVKLARYFLGSAKTYEGVVRFGETTVPGDPTSEVVERSDILPGTLDEIQKAAHTLTLQPYLQVPPMHSAKKLNGKALYELAREGIEVERAPKLCHLYRVEVVSYEVPRATIRVVCSSGTYIRTLAQDLGRLMGSVAMLDSLHRSGSGQFQDTHALTVEEISHQMEQGKLWNEFESWVPFDRLLDSYDYAEATADEAEALRQGRQIVLPSILKRTQPSPEPKILPSYPIDETQDKKIAIRCTNTLVAVASLTHGAWGLERVFE